MPDTHTDCSKRLSRSRRETNNSYEDTPELPASVWRLSSRHVLNDIEIENRGEERIVTVSEAAFVHATPLLAEIDGVRTGSVFLEAAASRRG